MTTSPHRQVSIEEQLAMVCEMAGRIRRSGVTPAVCEAVGTLLDSNDGPTPLVELFNWAHAKATTDPAVEQLRDDLLELLRICSRIGRHCIQPTAPSDQAVERFNRDAIADHLEAIVVRLFHESAGLRLLYLGRRSVR